VYSYGIILWELLTHQIPFQGMNGVQVSVAVVTQGLRPSLPDDCPVEISKLVTDCWDANPDLRPSFEEISSRIKSMKSLLV